MVLSWVKNVSWHLVQDCNGIHIGDDAEVGAKSGVFKNIPASTKAMGYPAGVGTEFFRHYAWIRKHVNKD